MEKIKFTIPGRPITKKNSQQLIRRGNRRFPIPSAQFRDYQDACGWHIPYKWAAIDFPVNIKCVYYMPTKGRVDLTNLLEATDDILVHYGVITDDNSDVVAGHDGSHVIKGCKDRPRVEITITEMETWTV